jgi:acyl-CoA synthetase (AMP-forming)/AMP-acid ligase II
MSELWTHLSAESEFHRSRVLFSNVAEDYQKTYRQFWLEARNLAMWFRSSDCHRVLLVLPNCEIGATLITAALISGVEICQMSNMSTPDEIAGAINQLKPDCVISSEPKTKFFESDKDSNPIHWVAIEGLSEKANGALEELEPIYFEYGKLIVFTSGSEGLPKSLVLSGRRIWESAQVFSHVYNISSSQRFWNYLPMNYLGGTFNLFLIPMAASASVYLDRPFDGKTFLQFASVVDREKISVLWLIPTIARGLLRLSSKDSFVRPLNQISLAFMGTAPSEAKERIAIEKLLGCEVYENYGLSETTFVLLEPLREPGSEDARRMITYPGVEVRQSEAEGCLEVKSPFVLDGIIDGTGRLIPNDDVWMDTRDRVSFSKGEIKLSGRKRDAIKKGGVLLNLAEVEASTRDFVFWGEITAIPVHDDFYGENYILVFESRGIDQDKADIIRHVSTKLSRSKLPQEVISAPDIAFTRSGKVDKRATLQNINLSYRLLGR